MMRGTDEASGSLFSYVNLEERVPARHPLQKVQEVMNETLERVAVIAIQDFLEA